MALQWDCAAASTAPASYFSCMVLGGPERVAGTEPAKPLILHGVCTRDGPAAGCLVVRRRGPVTPQRRVGAPPEGCPGGVGRGGSRGVQFFTAQYTRPASAATLMPMPIIQNALMWFASEFAWSAPRERACPRSRTPKRFRPSSPERARPRPCAHRVADWRQFSRTRIPGWCATGPIRVCNRDRARSNHARRLRFDTWEGPCLACRAVRAHGVGTGIRVGASIDELRVRARYPCARRSSSRRSVELASSKRRRGEWA